MRDGGGSGGDRCGGGGASGCAIDGGGELLLQARAEIDQGGFAAGSYRRSAPGDHWQAFYAGFFGVEERVWGVVGRWDPLCGVWRGSF